MPDSFEALGAAAPASAPPPAAKPDTFESLGTSSHHATVDSFAALSSPHAPVAPLAVRPKIEGPKKADGTPPRENPLRTAADFIGSVPGFAAAAFDNLPAAPWVSKAPKDNEGYVPDKESWATAMRLLKEKGPGAVSDYFDPFGIQSMERHHPGEKIPPNWFNTTMQTAEQVMNPANDLVGGAAGAALRLGGRAVNAARAGSPVFDDAVTALEGAAHDAAAPVRAIVKPVINHVVKPLARVGAAVMKQAVKPRDAAEGFFSRYGALRQKGGKPFADAALSMDRAPAAAVQHQLAEIDKIGKNAHGVPDLTEAQKYEMVKLSYRDPHGKPAFFDPEARGGRGAWIPTRRDPNVPEPKDGLSLEDRGAAYRKIYTNLTPQLDKENLMGDYVGTGRYDPRQKVNGKSPYIGDDHDALVPGWEPMEDPSGTGGGKFTTTSIAKRGHRDPNTLPLHIAKARGLLRPDFDPLVQLRADVAEKTQKLAVERGKKAAEHVYGVAPGTNTRAAVDPLTGRALPLRTTERVGLDPRVPIGYGLKGVEKLEDTVKGAADQGATAEARFDPDVQAKAAYAGVSVDDAASARSLKQRIVAAKARLQERGTATGAANRTRDYVAGQADKHEDVVGKQLYRELEQRSARLDKLNAAIEKAKAEGADHAGNARAKQFIQMVDERDKHAQRLAQISDDVERTVAGTFSSPTVAQRVQEAAATTQMLPYGIGWKVREGLQRVSRGEGDVDALITEVQNSQHADTPEAKKVIRQLQGLRGADPATEIANRERPVTNTGAQLQHAIDTYGGDSEQARAAIKKFSAAAETAAKQETRWGDVDAKVNPMGRISDVARSVRGIEIPDVAGAAGKAQRTITRIEDTQMRREFHAGKLEDDLADLRKGAPIDADMRAEVSARAKEILEEQKASHGHIYDVIEKKKLVPAMIWNGKKFVVDKAGEFANISKSLLQRNAGQEAARAEGRGRINGNEDELASEMGISVQEMMDHLAEHSKRMTKAEAIAQARAETFDRMASFRKTLDPLKVKRKIASTESKLAKANAAVDQQTYRAQGGRIVAEPITKLAEDTSAATRKTDALRSLRSLESAAQQAPERAAKAATRGAQGSFENAMSNVARAGVDHGADSALNGVQRVADRELKSLEAASDNSYKKRGSLLNGMEKARLGTAGAARTSKVRGESLADDLDQKQAIKGVQDAYNARYDTAFSRILGELSSTFRGAIKKPEGYAAEATLGQGSPSQGGKAIDSLWHDFLESRGKTGAEPFQNPAIEKVFKVYGALNQLSKAGIVWLPLVHSILNEGFPFLAEGGTPEAMWQIFSGARRFSPELEREAEHAGATVDSVMDGMFDAASEDDFRTPDELAARAVAKFGKVGEVASRVKGKADNAYDGMNNWLWHRVDRGYRLDRYESYRKAGMSPGDAARKVNASFGRVGDLSDAERKLQLNRIFFFYSWMKTVIPYWVQKGLVDPKWWQIPVEAIKDSNEAQGYDDPSRPFTATAGKRADGSFRRLTVPLPQRVLENVAEAARVPYDAATGDWKGALEDAASPVNYVRGHVNTIGQVALDAGDAIQAVRGRGTNVAPWSTFANAPGQDRPTTASVLSHLAERAFPPLETIPHVADDPAVNLPGYAFGVTSYGVKSEAMKAREHKVREAFTGALRVLDQGIKAAQASGDTARVADLQSKKAKITADAQAAVSHDGTRRLIPLPIPSTTSSIDTFAALGK